MKREEERIGNEQRPHCLETSSHNRELYVANIKAKQRIEGEELGTM